METFNNLQYRRVEAFFDLTNFSSRPLQNSPYRKFYDTYCVWDSQDDMFRHNMHINMEDLVPLLEDEVYILRYTPVQEIFYI